MLDNLLTPALIILVMIAVCLISQWLGYRKKPVEILFLITIALAIGSAAKNEQIGVLPVVFITYLVVESGNWIDRRFRRTDSF